MSSKGFLNYLWQPVGFVATTFFSVRYRINRFLWETTARIPARSEQYHKVLVIGDDIACGRGDSSWPMERYGLAARLETTMNSIPNIRMLWSVVSLGISGSTARDWVDKWWKEQVRDGRIQVITDAEIVIVCVGRMDCHPSRTHGDEARTLDEVMADLETLCERARGMGAHVVLNTVPEHGLVAGKFTPAQLNARIKAYVAAKGTPAEKDAPKIVLGADFHDQRLTSAESALGDSTVNPDGFELLSKLIMNALEPLAVKVEYGWWQRILRAQGREA